MQRTLTASFALTALVLSITACSSDNDSDGGNNTTPTGSVIGPVSAGATTPFTTVQNDDTPILTIGGSPSTVGSQAAGEPANPAPISLGTAQMPTEPGMMSAPTEPGTAPVQGNPGTTPTPLEPGTTTPPLGLDASSANDGTVAGTLSNGVTVEDLQSFWLCLTTNGSEEFFIALALSDDNAGIIADETVEFPIRWDLTTNNDIVFSFTDNPSAMGTIAAATFQSDDAFQSSEWTFDGEFVGRLTCQRTTV